MGHTDQPSGEANLLHHSIDHTMVLVGPVTKLGDSLRNSSPASEGAAWHATSCANEWIWREALVQAGEGPRQNPNLWGDAPCSYSSTCSEMPKASRLRYRDTGQCSQAWHALRATARRGCCQSSCKSAKPSFASSNACHIASGPIRCRKPICRQFSRTASSRCAVLPVPDLGTDVAFELPCRQGRARGGPDSPPAGGRGTRSW
jgi:hypothetical protein